MITAKEASEKSDAKMKDEIGLVENMMQLMPEKKNMLFLYGRFISELTKNKLEAFGYIVQYNADGRNGYDTIISWYLQ